MCYKATGGPASDLSASRVYYPLANHMQEALSLFEKGPLASVAGAGFEPATSGL
jgi:hypothetical protein